jgi:hypothetical protein
MTNDEFRILIIATLLTMVIAAMLWQLAAVLLPAFA